MSTTYYEIKELLLFLSITFWYEYNSLLLFYVIFYSWYDEPSWKNNKNELEKAAAQLQQGLADTSDENLKAVINLRLARVQVQLKQADAALKTLDAIKGEGWAAIVADLRGEALLSKGDKQGARSAWEAGVKSDVTPALSEMMQMKINNLSIWEGPDAIA